MNAQQTKRPINLDLFTIKFPLPAIISILHRISGVFVFLLIPLLLWMLDLSLSSPMGFDYLQGILTSLWFKFIVWLFLVALLYHLVAGIRHLIMDMGIGESLQGGQRGAQITILVTIVLALLAGVWLW
jgi:succinate dehydrogenase / fumarate reductase cytochrome b subunit